eukprot:m.267885 g.267885  ORF g.267885 m.267885 type:complete len:358 (+) comp75188_c0_seq1:256-1329(+)
MPPFYRMPFLTDPNGEHLPRAVDRHRLKLLYEIPHNFAHSVGDRATFHLSGEHLKAALGGDLGLRKVLVGPIHSNMGTVGVTMHYDQEGQLPVGSNKRRCLSPTNDGRYLQNPTAPADVDAFVMTATGTKLGCTEVDLHQDDDDGIDAFERGLGVTLRKLDTAVTTGGVSFVQVLLMREIKLSPISTMINQHCERAIVSFQLTHAREYTIDTDETSAFVGAEQLQSEFKLTKHQLLQVTHLTILEVKSCSAVGPVGLTMHHDRHRSLSIESPTRTVFVSGINGCAMAYHHVITPMNAYDQHSIELTKPCDFSNGFCFTLHRLTQPQYPTASRSGSQTHLFSEIRLELKYLLTDAPNR